ncbi:50S ribosomal protein L1 [Sphingobacteriales bacterium UPWRP_1]|nr:50S ribosomal protein L1 [Sphingobacteriales bacterium UPWRP_1]
MKLTKKRKAVNGRVDGNKLYALTEAAALVKEVNTTKFDSSVDLHVKLGVDPRKPDQAIRGSVSLPHGTGKVKRILVLCSPDKEEEAKQSGADYYGLNEYVDKILAGWTDIDVIIATPNVMAQVGKLGRILGPRGLMPNPKTGTITPNVAAAVEEVKKGKIDFKVDKYGIIHASVGRVSFSPEKIAENAAELMHTLARMKPTASKGVYIKSIYMASTMSPGIAIEPKTIKGI